MEVGMIDELKLGSTAVQRLQKMSSGEMTKIY